MEHVRASDVADVAGVAGVADVAHALADVAHADVYHAHANQIGHTESGSEKSETPSCLIYHLHGSMQVGFPALLDIRDYFAPVRTTGSEDACAIVPIANTRYDIKGPPAAY